ncbi:MAG TPA: heparinase II/III family protein, partial [Candidatus Saccharimonadales bacterium]|nr:heparinase II/III family protein [Candidatus Saccharimonadales bacterium]
ENRRLHPRRTFEALLDGAPSVPSAAPPTRTSRLFEPTGFAVLRSNRPPADQIQVIVKAGGDGDAHGHADQLAIQLFGRVRRLALDPGTPGYGISLNDTWYRQTASHSTVLLDSRSQPPVAARIHGVDARGGWSATSADVTWPGPPSWPATVERARACGWTDGASEAYVDVRMRRWLVLTDDYLIDAFAVDAPQPRTIDWLLHERGRFEGRTEPAPGVLSGRCGYDELRDVRRIRDVGSERSEGPERAERAGRTDRSEWAERADLPPSSPVSSPPSLPLTWTLDGSRVDLWLAPGEEARFLASAPGNPAADRHDLLIRRRTVQHTLFAAVIALAGQSGQRASVSLVTWEPILDGWAVAVKVGPDRQCWSIDDEGIAPAD